ncbi:MAG TPA: GyrI-like domain-containing protein [Thermomicrobiaceae bacterium]|nr:GyrI-like domain-containing protein [Thermomicrobiaceae bacterium]
MASTRTIRRPRTRAEAPHVREMATQHMAVVRTVGDPTVVAHSAIQALYGAVYALKFARKQAGRDFTVGPLRARWPDASTEPPGEWHGVWALPIPDDVDAVASRDPGIPIAVEDWEYGTVAEILHLGSYADEPASIDRLHAFIAAQGYAIAGPHEEEYLSMPGATVQRTLLRYRVRPAAAVAAA